MANTRQVKIEFRLISAGFERQIKRSTRKLEDFGRAANNLGTQLSVGLTAPIILAGRAIFESARIIDNATAKLIALADEGENAGQTLRDLQELSFLPGLEFPQVTKGVTNLRSLNFSLEESQAIMANAANAITLFGGTADQLDGFLLALQQIVGKGKVEAEEIKQLAERFPQIRGILLDAFGTSFGPDINKQLQAAGNSVRDFVRIINNELAKLTDAPLTIDAAFRTLQDSIRTALGIIGQDLAEEFNLTDIFTNLSVAVLALADRFKQLSPETKRFLVIGAAVAAAIGPLILIFGQLAFAIANITTLFTVLGSIALGPVSLGIAAVVASLAALHAAGVDIKPLLGGIIDALVFLGTTVKAIVVSGFKIIIGTISAFKQALAGDLLGARLAIKQFSDDVGDQGEDILRTFNNIFSSEGVGDSIISGSSEIVSDIKSAFGDIGQSLTVDFEALNDKYRKELDLLKDGIIQNTRGGLGLSKSEFQNAVNDLFLEPLQSFAGLRLDFAKAFNLRFFPPEDRADVRSVKESLQQVTDNANRTRESLLALQTPYLETLGVIEREVLFYERLGDLVGGTLTKGFEGFFSTILSGGEDAFQAFKRAIIDTVKELIAALAVATVLTAVFSVFTGGGALAGNLFGFVAGNGTSLFGNLFRAFSGIPFLAEGGIVTGPTTLVAGEKGKEAIIPLNKLNQFTSPNEILLNGQLTARGEDLVLVMEKVMARRNRIV